MKCCGCKKDFAAGDKVLAFYMGVALKGPKSGILGIYETPNSLGAENDSNVDHIHFLPGCLEMAFSPMENPFMFDILADEVRQQIYEEESERDRDFFPEMPSLIEDPPFCIFCKRIDTVWFHTSKGYPIFNCMACRKLWDHEEDELYWDQDAGDYFLLTERE